jgi:hypothetical protein
VLACTLVPADVISTIVSVDHHHIVMVATIAASPAAFVDPLDQWVYGAKKIAELAGLFDGNGEPDERAAYHGLENGYIDADKYGRQWRSTPRRILNSPSK